MDRDGNVLAQTLTFAALHVLVGLIWLTFYAHMVGRARDVLTEAWKRL